MDLQEIPMRRAPKVAPAKERKLSPLLAASEKQAAWELGQSLDSKKVTSALGYLDLKQICYCLARALARHIEFSRGHFFLDDLKVMRKQNETKVENLDFSYNLGKDLKIDIEEAKKKQKEKKKKEDESKK